MLFSPSSAAIQLQTSVVTKRFDLDPSGGHMMNLLIKALLGGMSKFIMPRLYIARPQSKFPWGRLQKQNPI